MTFPRKCRIAVCVVPSLLFLSVSTRAQEQAAKIVEIPCFGIRVHINGKSVRGPERIIVASKNDVVKISLEAGCFKVPLALLREKAIDVSFEVPQNRVYLSSVATGFFVGPWDVYLEDKSFGTRAVLPKHAKTREACAVTFHAGEPETTFAMAPCRSPLSKKQKRKETGG